MSYSIEVNDELKIIFYKHSGLIERRDLGEVWKELLGIKEFSEGGYNLYSDYRNGKLNLIDSDMEVISDFLNSINHILKGKKESVLVADNSSTAIALLYENDMFSEIGFDVKAFSTERAALNFLLK